MTRHARLLIAGCGLVLAASSILADDKVKVYQNPAIPQGKTPQIVAPYAAPNHGAGGLAPRVNGWHDLAPANTATPSPGDNRWLQYGINQWHAPPQSLVQGLAGPYRQTYDPPLLPAAPLMQNYQPMYRWYNPYLQQPLYTQPAYGQTYFPQQLYPPQTYSPIDSSYYQAPNIYQSPADYVQP